MTDKKAILKHKIRKKDVDIVFKNYDTMYFFRGLELGAGDGFQSRLIKQYVKYLVCTEYYKELLGDIKDIDGVEYRIVDANFLQEHFLEKEFNLIFSSHVLEHLSGIEYVVISMHKILSNDGIMIHILPNRLWKILHVVIWYVRYPIRIIKILTKKEQKNTKGRSTQGNNPKKATNYSKKKKYKQFFFPKTHGIEENNYKEFLAFGKRKWKSVFQDAGFVIIEIKKLQFHTPYRYNCEFARLLLTRMGICSSYAYYVKKKKVVV